MLDTNIMVSAALYPNSKVSLALTRAMQNHTLIVCTYVLEELQSVFKHKFPHKLAQLDTFLSKLAFDLCYTPRINPDTPHMRDENDRPILQSAIDAEADAILTGDDDFHSLNLDRPIIISPAKLFDSNF